MRKHDENIVTVQTYVNLILVNETHVASYNNLKPTAVRFHLET